jgi:uncharacterized protein
MRLTSTQIAVDEAVPYEEFKQNPYTVHCSTSLGGHLAWFEIGGSRWFSKPVSTFLKVHKLLPDQSPGQIAQILTALAEVDFDKTKAEQRPVTSPDSQILTRYEPMKRKLTILPA